MVNERLVTRLEGCNQEFKLRFRWGQELGRIEWVSFQLANILLLWRAILGSSMSFVLLLLHASSGCG